MNYSGFCSCNRWIMDHLIAYRESPVLNVYLLHRKGQMDDCVASVNCLCMSSQGILGLREATTGTSLWCGSGSCWVLHTLHQSWQWLVTGFEFYLRRPELRYLFVSYVCFIMSVSSKTFPSSLVLSPSLRWKNFGPTPLTGLKTSKICQ